MAKAQKRVETRAKFELPSNRRGILGWFNPFRFNIERYGYALQRLTGIGIVAFLVGHVMAVNGILSGREGWYADINALPHWLLVIVVAGLAFHGVNGIRLILSQLGLMMGRPRRPDYPYKASSLNWKQQTCLWLTIVLTVIALVYGWQVVLGGLF